MILISIYLVIWEDLRVLSVGLAVLVVRNVVVVLVILLRNICVRIKQIVLRLTFDPVRPLSLQITNLLMLPDVLSYLLRRPTRIPHKSRLTRQLIPLPQVHVRLYHFILFLC